MPALLIVAASALLLAAWAASRRFRSSETSATVAPALPPEVPALQPAVFVDPRQIEAANGAAAARLWRLAFAAPHVPAPHDPAPHAPASQAAHHRVRENITALLSVDTLDPEHFPRRPALMPQLLQAVNDPDAASERLSRIVAHDPVLTADVLRLANSSLYRMSPVPIETIQRAIVVCGVDALRGMLAAVMLRPVFRATRRNFTRLPRMLWERTERASRAAELYAVEISPQDRFEAQLAVLLSALGPLVVYSAAMDVYARNPHFSPSGELCVELINAWAPRMSLRIARDWQASPRLIAALESSSAEPLTVARHVGEFLGTLAFLESQTVLSRDERMDLIGTAGIPPDLATGIWRSMGSS